MADIDLIPKQYVAQRLLRRRGRQLAAALLGVACLVGAARAGLWVATSHEQQELARLRRNETDSAATRARVQEFEAQKAAAEKQLKSLTDLRGRGRAALVLNALDGAYLNGVWLDEIRSFRTAPAEAQPAVTVAKPATPAPAPAPAAATTPARPMQQRVELAGHAVDHARLAAFITRLSGQPAFAEVQLLDTSARAYSAATIVDFKVMLVVSDKLPDVKVAGTEAVTAPVKVAAAEAVRP